MPNPNENAEKPSIEFKKICSQSEFFSYKRRCLSTYKDDLFDSMITPFKKLLNIALYLIKLQILIYIILGLLYVFNQNNVPVPEWSGIGTLDPKDIYKLSFHIFTAIVSLHLFIVVTIKVLGVVIFPGVRMMDREAALNALIVTILIGLVSTGIYFFTIYVPHGGENHIICDYNHYDIFDVIFCF